MRLIDADALKHSVPKCYVGEHCETCTLIDYEDVNDLIDTAPTIDAVQVVRCKDCKHGHECYGVGMYSIVCEFSNYMNSPNGFCHEGKRKDE